MHPASVHSVELDQDHRSRRRSGPARNQRTLRWSRSTRRSDGFVARCERRGAGLSVTRRRDGLWVIGVPQSRRADTDAEPEADDADHDADGDADEDADRRGACLRRRRRRPMTMPADDGSDQEPAEACEVASPQGVLGVLIAHVAGPLSSSLRCGGCRTAERAGHAGRWQAAVPDADRAKLPQRCGGRIRLPIRRNGARASGCSRWGSSSLAASSDRRRAAVL